MFVVVFVFSSWHIPSRANCQDSAQRLQIEKITSRLEKLNGIERIPSLLDLAELRTDCNEILKLADEILQLNSKQPQPNIEAKARILRSKSLQSLGKYAESLKEAEQSIKLAQSTGQRETLSRAFYVAAVADFRLANYKSAEKKSKQALSFQDNDDSKELATIHTLIGAIARSRGKFENAIENHLVALQISERLNHESGIARSQNNLGLIYWKLDQLENAHRSLSRALKTYENLNNEKNVCACLSNLGLVLTEMGKPEEAVSVLERALASKTIQKTPHAHARVFANLAFANEELGNNEKAAEFHRKALDLRQKIGDKKGIVRSSGCIAGIYQEMGKHEEALPILEEILALAKEIDAKPEVAAVLSKLSLSKEALGLHAAALADFKEYHQLQMELSGPEVLERIAILEQEHERDQRKANIRRLEELADSKERELAHQRAAKRNFVIASVILSFCLILFVVLFTTRTRAHRQLKRANDELRETTRDLSESETRYRLLFESSDAAKVLVDIESREIVDLNPSAKAIFDQPTASAANSKSKSLDVTWLDQVVKEYFESGVEDGAGFEDCWTDQHGNLQWIEIRGGKVLLNGRKAILLNIRDTTDERSAEKTQFRSEKLESLGVLAGGIAHDFNNALTAISGFAAAARFRLGDDVPELKLVEEVALQSSELSGQLLSFAKGGEPVKAVQEVSMLLQQSVELACKGSSIEVTMDLDEDLWQASIDAGQFRQVVSNLVINAKDAMPTDGILTVKASNIEECPSSECDPHSKFICIEFKDNGVGIPKNVRDKIFDPYWTTKEDGTGLGLATTYSILKRHGGTVTCKSREGQGTTFSIFFPASEISSETLAENNDESVKTILHPLRILILEDEPLIRKVYKSLLERDGHRIHTVSDGKAAVESFLAAFDSESPFDLIIMDLTIPGGMGGREAIAEIQNVVPNALAIVASGYSNDPTMANYRQAGFAGAISKPFSESNLKTAIRSAIRIRQPSNNSGSSL